MRGSHAEIDIVIILRPLPIHYGNHTVLSRFASLILVVHEGQFEIRGVLGLLLRVRAVFESVDKIRASALIVFEFVRVDSAFVCLC